jgi:hypothetical protein
MNMVNLVIKSNVFIAYLTHQSEISFSSRLSSSLYTHANLK